jgi:hypothetical protein
MQKFGYEKQELEKLTPIEKPVKLVLLYSGFFHFFQERTQTD